MTDQSSDPQLGASCSPIESTVCVVDLQILLMFFVCSVLFSFLFCLFVWFVCVFVVVSFCFVLLVCLCIFAVWFVLVRVLVGWFVYFVVGFYIGLLVGWLFVYICVVRMFYFDSRGGISDCHSTN